MSLPYLLLLDTDKIKDYVFSSSKLKEIRGASILLEYLNIYLTPVVIEKTLKDKYDNRSIEELYHVIYLDGGSGKVEFKSREDAIFCGERVKELYKTISKTASITWAVVSVEHEDEYLQSVSYGEHLLRIKKQDGPEPGHTISQGIISRCKHCGSGYHENHKKSFNATMLKFSELFSEDFSNSFQEFYKSLFKKTYDNQIRSKLDQDVCFSCFTKRMFSMDSARELLKGNIDELPIHTYINQLYNGEVSWPKQLSTISNVAVDGYIAFLYFDGNSMNKKLRLLKDRSEFILFSQNLRRNIRKSLVETIYDIYPSEDLNLSKNEDEYDLMDKLQLEKVLPLDIIMMAGDDLIIVLPADKALAFVSSYQQKFAMKNNEELTMSAGISITKSTFPIKYIIPFTEQLLKSAKKKNYELYRDNIRNWKDLSTLDYMLVKSISNPDLEQIRSEQFTKREEQSDYYMYVRPLTWSQWSEMSSTIIEMKKAKEAFPKSKMKNFYNLHYMDKWEGTYHFGKYFIKLPKNQREILRKYYSTFSNTEFDSMWIEKKKTGKKEYVSPLIDLLEIYPYATEGS